MESVSTLTRADRGSFEVRTLNTTYLIELINEDEAWATRFPQQAEFSGPLRKDGDRLPLLGIEATVDGYMVMLLAGVADSGANTLRGPTSQVTDIIKVV